MQTSTKAGEDVKKRLQTMRQTRTKTSIKTDVVSDLSDTKEGKTLIGKKDCERLNLVQRVPIRQVTECDLKFSDDGNLGTLPYVYDIKLKENVTPVVHPPRRVPVALKNDVYDELQRMVKQGVIEKITQPTDWVNSMVVVKKPNGKLRICLDPKDLNASIKRKHHYLPRREDISSQMAGAKIFSKLDLSQGFWQIKLTEQSSKLCCFNTPLLVPCFSSNSESD